MRASSPTRGLPRVCRKSEWQAAVDALVAHMRDGRIADGFIAAIDPAATSSRGIFRAARRTATNCRTGFI